MEECSKLILYMYSIRYSIMYSMTRLVDYSLLCYYTAHALFTSVNKVKLKWHVTSFLCVNYVEPQSIILATYTGSSRAN